MLLMLIRRQLKSRHQKVPSSSCAAAFSWIYFIAFQLRRVTQRSAIHDTCQSRVGNRSSRREIIVRSKDRRAGSSVAKFYFHEWPQIRGFQVICCIAVFESIWLFHKSEVSLKFWKRIQGAFLIISTVTLQVKGRQASFCFRKKCPAVFLLKQPVINQVLKRKGGCFRAVTRCYTFEAFLWCTASKLRRFI